LLTHASQRMVIFAGILLCILMAGIYMRREFWLREKEQQCIENMRIMWINAHCYWHENPANATDAILNPVEVNYYAKESKRLITCPFNGVQYPPFSYLSGPTCPNGHSLPQDVWKEQHKWALREIKSHWDWLREPQNFVQIEGISSENKVKIRDARTNIAVWLGKGEKTNNIEVIEIDFPSASVRIRYDTNEFKISMK